MESLGGDETILVVDDDAMVAAVVARGLKRLGYDVLEAHSLEDALQRAKEHEAPIQLLLTDVIMPGANGREVEAAVRHVSPEIRVLYISGYAEDVVLNDGVLDAGVDLIQKPFSVGELARFVRRVLDRPSD